MNEYLHISQTGAPHQRTAATLAIAQLRTDAYHNAISHAAKELIKTQRLCEQSKCRCPNYRAYVYACQYESGATLWRNLEDELTVLVDTNGKIADELVSARCKE